MAIKKPSEVKNEITRIRMLIAGFPGIGKTTLALSSPKPLHIDVDKGVTRVQAKNRKDYIQPETYEELLQDLKGDLSDYETLVFDTGGKLLDIMKPYVIKKDSKNGQKDGSTLSIKGYGIVGKEFSKILDYAFYELKKNVIVVFHAKEEKDNDQTKLRILVEGASKDNVWQNMELGCFMEIYNNKRTIGFDNCERYFAKGTNGIHGVREITDLDNEKIPNDYLTKLFEEYNENIKKDTEYFENLNQQYEAVMNEVLPKIEAMTFETLEEVTEYMKTVNHILTSEKELKFKFKEKLKELNIKWDSETKAYVLIEEVKEDEISNNTESAQ